jgi:hypothetical protein
MKKLIMIMVGFFLCMVSFAYAGSNKDMPSAIVGQAIGYAMSHESFNPKKKINVKIQNIQNKLQNYLMDRGFKLKSVLIVSHEKNGKQLNVKGSVIHIDSIHRFIQTGFDARCSIENKTTILVNKVQLSNNSKPNTLFFIVPAEKIKSSDLKNISFSQALQQVSFVAKKIDGSDVGMDYHPEKYKLIAFIMNKLNDSDSVYPVVSDTPFTNGEKGSLIETADGWHILLSEAEFGYNDNNPKYFNVLWEKDNNVVAFESYCTQGLIKAIQTALLRNGYNVGILDGRLSENTELAVKKYIKTAKFHKNTQISSSLLWFMQQNKQINISELVQIALLQNGINIGSVDGQVGPTTIKGLKKYQKRLDIKADGKITPELVLLLLQTSKNIDVYSHIRTLFQEPILIKKYQDKMWPNEL